MFGGAPPLLGVEGVGRGNALLMSSSASVDCISQSGSKSKECYYLGLSDCSSIGSSAVSNVFEENKNNLNLSATELMLGLLGSRSLEQDLDFNLLTSCKLDEKQLFPLLPSKDGICSSSQKSIVSENKRGFSYIVGGFSEIKSFVFSDGK
ncbi:Auxin-responsive protein IAA9 [Forsythia ovata]|uniref:Auxin-responsive protein IAA9 n=1 Tax=Forsythia ovata TaxID=205694 RepID=A0ABD1WV72_9LAMI